MSRTISWPADHRPATAALDILARAERRLVGHIARRGIDAEALAICATYERMYAAVERQDELAPLLDLDAARAGRSRS